MKSRQTLSAAVLVTMLASSVNAATYTWTGTAADSTIGTAANWSPNLTSLAAADTVVFDGTGTVAGTLTLAGATLNGGNPGFTAFSLTSGQTTSVSINSSAAAGALNVIRMGSTGLTASTNGISLASGSGSLTFNATNVGGLVLNAGGGGSSSSTFSLAITNNNASGGSKIVFGSNMYLSGGGSGSNTAVSRSFNFGGTGDIDVNGRILNSSRIVQITKSGTGTLTLAGNNIDATNVGGGSGIAAFSGGTTITDGVLVVAHQNALGTGNVTVNGGTLRSSVATVSGIGNLGLASGATLDLNSASAGAIGLKSNSGFTMTGGTWEFTLGDQITGTGASSSFSISSGILDLNSSISDYSVSYTLLSGFSSGSVTGLTINGYDNTNWLASLSNSGVLSFTAAAVPEPSAFASLAGAAVLGAVALRRRRRA